MQFSVMKALMFATFSVAFCCGSSEAVDAVRDGWVTNGRPVDIIKNEPRSDGKRVTITVSNATRVDRRGAIHGVVFHVTMTGGHTNKHVAIPAANLLEFEQRSYMPGGANPKSWFSDFIDDAVEWVKDAKEWLQRVRKLTDRLKELAAPIREAIRIVLELADALGISVAEELADALGEKSGGEVVARYTANVKAAAHARAANGFALPLNERVAQAYKATVQAYKPGPVRAAVVSGFHSGLMEQY